MEIMPLYVSVKDRLMATLVRPRSALKDFRSSTPTSLPANLLQVPTPFAPTGRCHSRIARTDSGEPRMFKKHLHRFLALGWVFALLALPLTAEAQTATLLSQGRPAVASSTEAPFVAANAVDGNTGTRWGSAFTNNEWIYVD